ncbi:UNVERIFIED_CONTAM: hypothetical protein N8J90_13435 [Halobacillus marinus]
MQQVYNQGGTAEKLPSLPNHQAETGVFSVSVKDEASSSTV